MPLNHVANDPDSYAKLLRWLNAFARNSQTLANLLQTLLKSKWYQGFFSLEDEPQNEFTFNKLLQMPESFFKAFVTIFAQINNAVREVEKEKDVLKVIVLLLETMLRKVDGFIHKSKKYAAERERIKRSEKIEEIPAEIRTQQEQLLTQYQKYLRATMVEIKRLENDLTLLLQRLERFRNSAMKKKNEILQPHVDELQQVIHVFLREQAIGAENFSLTSEQIEEIFEDANNEHPQLLEALIDEQPTAEDIEEFAAITHTQVATAEAIEKQLEQTQNPSAASATYQVDRDTLIKHWDVQKELMVAIFLRDYLKHHHIFINLKQASAMALKLAPLLAELYGRYRHVKVELDNDWQALLTEAQTIHSGLQNHYSQIKEVYRVHYQELHVLAKALGISVEAPRNEADQESLHHELYHSLFAHLQPHVDLSVSKEASQPQLEPTQTSTPQLKLSS